MMSRFPQQASVCFLYFVECLLLIANQDTAEFASEPTVSNKPLSYQSSDFPAGSTSADWGSPISRSFSMPNVGPPPMLEPASPSYDGQEYDEEVLGRRTPPSVFEPVGASYDDLGHKRVASVGGRAPPPMFEPIDPSYDGPGYDEGVMSYVPGNSRTSSPVSILSTDSYRPPPLPPKPPMGISRSNAIIATLSPTTPYDEAEPSATRELNLQIQGQGVMGRRTPPPMFEPVAPSYYDPEYEEGAMDYAPGTPLTLSPVSFLSTDSYRPPPLPPKPQKESSWSNDTLVMPPQTIPYDETGPSVPRGPSPETQGQGVTGIALYEYVFPQNTCMGFRETYCVQ